MHLHEIGLEIFYLILALEGPIHIRKLIPNNFDVILASGRLLSILLGIEKVHAQGSCNLASFRGKNLDVVIDADTVFP